jgi:hypothetical protein
MYQILYKTHSQVNTDCLFGQKLMIGFFHVDSCIFSSVYSGGGIRVLLRGCCYANSR